MSRILKSVDQLSSAIWTAVLGLFAVAFIGSGIYAGKPGLIACGIGWVLFFITPLFFRGSSSTRLTLWLRLTGVLAFLLGLAVHSGAP